jgi:hypothetical protein
MLGYMLFVEYEGKFVGMTLEEIIKEEEILVDRINKLTNPFAKKYKLQGHKERFMNIHMITNHRKKLIELQYFLRKLCRSGFAGAQ